jgi:segregation and condensation protein B
MTDEREIGAAIEAVLLVATEPVEPAVLAQLVEIPKASVEEWCERLAAEYAAEGRGFTIMRVAGGYRFQTAPEFAPYVERFVLEGQTARLSGPALETLAIVAYKQPISRAQLSAIRGVNVDATLRTLVQRGYVEESGHEATPGNPALFSTTTMFCEKLGIDSLADLPALADFIPDSPVVEALERGLRIPTAHDAVADLRDEGDAVESGDSAAASAPSALALMDEVATEKVTFDAGDA